MKNSIENKTLVLGIGAMKAGTTWLYSYFCNHPEIYTSSIKELHYFDQVYRPDMCGHFGRTLFAEPLARRLANPGAESQIKGGPNIADLADRVRMNHEGDGAYVSFFAKRVPENTPFFCEITPSYSLLRENGFAAIRALFPKVKIIFLMRDPVERYYSALRMAERGGVINANHEFQRQLYEPFHYERGRYDLTIGSLLTVFDKQDVFFGFYETLFTEKEIRRLTDFLGASYVDPVFSNYFNVGVPPRPLTELDLQLALEAYAPVYDFCKSFFGSAIPGAWRC